jgi:hypothetical protein
MVILLLLAMYHGPGDESRQDLDGQDFVFLVQRFPGIGLVEEKVEEVGDSFSQVRSPW